MASLAHSPDLPSGVRLPNRTAKAALSEALGDADALAMVRRNGRASFTSRRGPK